MAERFAEGREQAGIDVVVQLQQVFAIFWSDRDQVAGTDQVVPLDRLAAAYARLATLTDDSRFGAAPTRLAAAMTAHPEMVSGEGRNDLILMRAGGGDWVTKAGAEGVQGIGVRSRGWGIALKVVDGNPRGLHPATVAVLDLLGLLDAVQRQALQAWREPVIRNYRGLATGRVEPIVRLERRS